LNELDNGAITAVTETD